MDKVIYKKIRLRTPVTKAFDMFIKNEELEKWLTTKANIENYTGGSYELFWIPEDKENDSTIGCKILAYNENRFLSFEWKGAKQFKHFMNNIKPLTNVVVSFTPLKDNTTEINFIHTGWRDTKEWNEAFEWFKAAWDNAFNTLIDLYTTD